MQLTGRDMKYLAYNTGQPHSGAYQKWHAVEKAERNAFKLL